MHDTRENLLIERIERSVHFMIAELKAGMTPSLDEIASAAAISKYHFHRVYRLVAGETCAETMRRIRLAQGATHLSHQQSSVTDAAFEAGYATSQAFAKALKAVLSASASDLKADPERLSSAVSYLSVPADGGAKTPPLLTVELASLDPFDIIVKRHRGDPAAENSVYEALFEAAGGFENVRAILGFPHSDPRYVDLAECVEDCALKTGVLPTSLPPGMVIKEVPAGMFLLTRHKGSFDDMEPVFDALYQAALSMDFIELANRPMFIHYLDDPEETPDEDQRADVYLPFESNQS